MSTENFIQLNEAANQLYNPLEDQLLHDYHHHEPEAQSV